MILRLRLAGMTGLLVAALATRAGAQGPSPLQFPSLRDGALVRAWATPDRQRSIAGRLDSGRSYRPLGTWIGFGLGIALSPLTWGLCEEDEVDCTTTEKIMHAGVSGALGAFAGFLIGGAIKRD